VLALVPQHLEVLGWNDLFENQVTFLAKLFLLTFRDVHFFDFEGCIFAGQVAIY